MTLSAAAVENKIGRHLALPPIFSSRSSGRPHSQLGDGASALPNDDASKHLSVFPLGRAPGIGRSRATGCRRGRVALTEEAKRAGVGWANLPIFPAYVFFSFVALSRFSFDGGDATGRD